jgi:tetratricopeptide (TPR) repeat protein
MGLVETSDALRATDKRYHLHPLVREFVIKAAPIAPTTEPELWAFHQHGYAETAAQAWWREVSATEGVLWGQAAERANMLLAVREALRHRMYERVQPFYDGTRHLLNKGYYSEYIEVEQNCLEAAHTMGEREREAALYAEIGYAKYCQGLLDEADMLLQKSVALFEELPNSSQKQKPLRYQTYVLLVRGAHQAAYDAATKIIAWLEPLKEQATDARSYELLRQQVNTLYNTRGHALWRMGDLDGAERELQHDMAESLLEHPTTSITGLLDFARLKLAQKQWAEAEQRLAICYEVCQIYDIPVKAAETREAQAELAIQRGDHAHAKSMRKKRKAIILN